MRQQLNENPMVQMAVLGLAGVAFAILLFMTVLKKDPPVEDTTTTPPAAGATAAGAAVAPPATADTAIDPATGAPVGTAPPADGTVPPPAATTDPGSSDGLLPTKGLPKDVLIAYAKDKTIALLVIDPKAQEPYRHLDEVKALSSDDVEVFVVDVKDVADYSRITSGVSVSRTPALVTVRPRKLTDSVPTATVKYGVLSPDSVKQALADAAYKGDNVPAYPTGK